MAIHIILEIQDGSMAGNRTQVPESRSIRVGRSRSADLTLPHDIRMSGEHFIVESTVGVCRLRDLKSSNGTFLDEKRIDEAELFHGATIRAGNTNFLVKFEADAPPARAPETTFQGRRDPDDATMATVQTRMRERRPSPVLQSSPQGPAPAPVEPRRERPRAGSASAPASVVNGREPKPPVSVPAPMRQSAAARPVQNEVRKVILPGQTPEGHHILSVLLKRTYDIVSGGPCVRSEKDQKLIPGDVHYGDPMNTTVKLESDFVPYKLATDVVLHGKVYAPQGVGTPELKAALRVGPVSKEIHVVGDRVCRYQGNTAPAFSDPKPFTTMELRYELAYGGVDIHSDPNVPCIYARNHLGRGFAVKNTKVSVEGLPLPNLEDPADRLTPDRLCVEKFWEWERQPMPASFGWFCKYWRPRAMFAGVMPADRLVAQQLRAMYAPAVPQEQRAMYEQTNLPNMDFRFFNGASPGLVAPFLRGDEEVRAVNLTQEGKLSFRLPGDSPGIGVDIGGGVQQPEVVLHTVMIRMEDRQVDLVWRGAIPYAGPDSLPDLKKMEVEVR